MGKKLVIAGFLACSMIAAWVYLTRERRVLRVTAAAGDPEPRVVLDDFTAIRYKDGVMAAQVSARLGHFYEPNQVTLDGDVHAERRGKDGLETFSGESAVGVFDAQAMSAMIKGRSELERAEVTGYVEVSTQSHALSTDSAVYEAATATVSSEKPVRVEGPNRIMTGENGFSYDLNTGSLSLPGAVRGVIALEKTP